MQTLKIILFIFVFFLYIWVFYLHVYVWDSLELALKLSAAMWVLGIEPGSFGRIDHALKLLDELSSTPPLSGPNRLSLCSPGWPQT